MSLRIVNGQDGVEGGFVLGPQLPDAQVGIAAVAGWFVSRLKGIKGTKQLTWPFSAKASKRALYPRDDGVAVSVTVKAEDGGRVGTPDGCWPLGGEIPQDNPAVAVARQQARVAADEAHSVDRGSMAAEDVDWERRRG